MGRDSMKGIILAGGAGTRLYPVTRVLSKQLLPIYDKPMVYYPLSTLMLAGIREILLIGTPRDLPAYRELFGDGSRLGLVIRYAEQPRPEGIAQALLIARTFVGDGSVGLILGDNIFFGRGLGKSLRLAAQRNEGATVFLYRVSDPSRYGVAEFDGADQVTRIVEKPARPRSSHVVTGLYFYDNRAGEIAASLTPSARGELEITDVNQRYIDLGALRAERLGRGTAWLDTGTNAAWLAASTFVDAVQSRQGLMIACVEEVAYRMGYIDSSALEALARDAGPSDYGAYLERLAAQELARP